jgi:heat shock protein HtpX
MAIRRSIRDQIGSNVRASLFYSFLLILLLAALGAAIVGVYTYPDMWYAGAIAGAGLGLIMAFIARYAGPGLILSMSGAREASGPEFRVLDNVAEEMAIAAGIPKPKVMVIDDSAPNAFATGPDPRHAVVVFTTGIIDKLDRDELQGVMAHEIGHIRNYDIRFMATIALIAGLIPLLADGLRRAFWYGGGGRKSKDGAGAIFAIVALLLSILAPLFSVLLHMAISRQREFLADSTACELTRYPEGLARALEKIAADPEPLEAANRATEHLYIVNPLQKFHEGMSALLSTHPDTSERVRRLHQLMGSYPSPGAKSHPDQIGMRHADDFSDMPEIPDPRS